MDENMENTRVCGHVRASTAGQVKEGLSLEQQKEEIVDFCEENNYDLIKMYEDAGISGAKVDEGGLPQSRTRDPCLRVTVAPSPLVST